MGEKLTGKKSGRRRTCPNLRKILLFGTWQEGTRQLRKNPPMGNSVKGRRMGASGSRLLNDE